MAWSRWWRRDWAARPTAATFSCSAPSDPNKRHSAYSFRRATIAYRWHPLFGRTLQVSRNRRGKDLTCIYTDERPDLARELPNWMFEERYCAGMSLGPPQVSIEALNALAAVLAAGGKSAKRGSRSRPSETEGGDSCPREGTRIEDNSRWTLEPRRPTPFPAPPSAKGLIEALADLLLEALGERTTAVEGSEGGGHEPQDHG